MEIEKSDRVLNEFYDRFVNHYNESDNKVVALAVLNNNKRPLEERINALNEEVNVVLHWLRKRLADFQDSEDSTKIKEEALDQLKEDIDKHRHIYFPDEVQKRYKASVKRLYKSRGLEYLSLDIHHSIKPIILKGKKIELIKCQIKALTEVVNRIIDHNYPDDKLNFYRALDESEQARMRGNEGYEPHHNTRQDLIKDLKKIINEIKNKSRFFHEDGIIKHTRVAKYAVNQKWFTDKHGHGKRGLHEHIKYIYNDMNST